MTWLIALPAWGDRCAGLAINVAIPSIVAALRLTTSAAKFIIFTDRPAEFANVCGEYPHECLWMTTSSKFSEFGRCHLKVLEGAEPGNFVALLNADQIVSRETFTFAEKCFAAGKRIMICGGIRTLGIDVPGPGATAEAVQHYAVSNPHKIAIDCMWPTGGTEWPSVMYLRQGPHFAMHGFHLHPYAVVARQGLRFNKTIDYDLTNCFTEAETQIVTDNAMALAEISPVTKVFAARSTQNTEEFIAGWAQWNTNLRHRWFFKHRIAMTGDPDVFGPGPIDKILARLDP